ncbi:MAG: choice-of-anchor D domain-containing protein [Bacteroidales bacterium]|nr:choice-of-anchor D domain-containing protein [Bacteroidales bacterium]
MKRLIILIWIAVGLTAQAQNSLSLTGGNGHPGDTVTVTLALENSDAVTALQTFIPLGDNLTYVPGSAALTSRSNGHTLTATVMDGSLRIYSYSLALASYTGNSGALLTFRVVLGQEPGAITLTPTSTVLSSASGASLSVDATSGTVTVQAPKVHLSVSTVNYGHVPIRSSYTRSVTLQNIGNEPLTLTGVTFSDSTLVCPVPTALAAGAQQTVTLTYSPVRAGATTMSAIFHTNAKVGDSVLTISADPYSVNELRPLSCSGYTDSTAIVELRMNNMDSIMGLQTSIKLPSALTYVEGSFAPDATRAAGYTATAGLLGDTLVLLLTNLGGTPIHGADGVVARFTLRLHGYGSYTLRLLQTALSDSTGANVLSAVYTGTLSIYSPTLNCSSSLDMGNTPVTETATATMQVRNTGNAPLVIDRAVFTQDGWHLLNSLPLTINNSGRDTLRITYSGSAEGSYSAQLLLYTNDPRNDLKRISLTAQRYEPNDLYMAGNAEAGAATPEVYLMLDNYSAVTALQMDVQYPHRHFTMEPGDISLTARGNGHIVSAARQNDSTLRVLVLSMQNSPFVGNSGAVARMQMHALDSLDTQSYPVSLLNVTSGCTDGVDRLSSIQTVGWFATRLIHDTTYIDVHDTTYIDVFVHDTTIVHDTTMVPYAVHDTTIIHDTTMVPYAVHDTTYINIHDTTYVNVPVHDTTYINIHDTTYVNVPVHDTTYINVPYPVHDTTIVTLTDTVTNIVYDTITNTVYDTVNHYIYDTTLVTVTDTLWLPGDTVYIFDTVYLHDTIYVGVDEVETVSAKIYTHYGQIVVEGAEGNTVTLYDAVGRLLATRRDDFAPLRFDVQASGAYLVKIGNHPARRVVVIR